MKTNEGENSSVNKTRLTVSVLCAALCLSLLSGCALFRQRVTELHGSIIGNTYTIDIFDNFGNKTLTTHGQKISVEPNIIKEQVFHENGGWGYEQSVSSVLTINIDGKQMITCGDTAIFYEKGLEPDYDFSVENIYSASSGTLSELTLASGIINSIKNDIGKSVVIVIKSQTGAPIYAFSGDSVRWEVPDDLPKFTRLIVDGKALYIHRSNFQIIDKKLLY